MSSLFFASIVFIGCVLIFITTMVVSYIEYNKYQHELKNYHDIKCIISNYNITIHHLSQKVLLTKLLFYVILNNTYYLDIEKYFQQIVYQLSSH